MTHDDKGRIIDLRNYVQELYDFDYDAYKAAKMASNRAKWAEIHAIRDANWEKSRKLSEEKPYWRYYRAIRTTHERRLACSEEHQPYIRGRRSFASLPNAYDDLYFRREKSWKARSKGRRQWEVNMKKHKDTVKWIKRPSLWESEESITSDSIAENGFKS
jgi:hypothetical protein